MQCFSKVLGIGFVFILGANTLCANSAHAQIPQLSLLAIEEVAGKAWDIIEKNKPTANLDSESASALPKIANSSWETITGWKPEAIVHASLPLKNYYGMKVVDLEYDVRVVSGGSVNGHGLYIAYAQVIPSLVKVFWSYNLTVKVNVASVYNAGTKAKPVGAIILDVQSTFGSIALTQTASDSFLIRGDGLIQHLNDGQILVEGSEPNLVAAAPTQTAELP